LAHRDSAAVALDASGRYPAARIDVQRYAVLSVAARGHPSEGQPGQPVLGEHDVLAALLADPWYDYDFERGRGAQPEEARGVHGPYRIAELDDEDFALVARAEALECVDAWLLECAGASPERLAAEPSLAEVCAGISKLVSRVLPERWAVLRLQATPQADDDEPGSLANQAAPLAAADGLPAEAPCQQAPHLGFLEFVAVAPDLSELAVFAAAADQASH